MPLISVCIPTFNRARFLINLLGNLRDIHAEHGDAVEICVSNNSSTDETEQVLANYALLLPIKVVKQPTNIGSMMNVKAVAEMASAETVLVMGDDDQIDPTGFRFLMERLRKGRLEDRWLFVNVASEHSFSGYRIAKIASRLQASDTARFLLRIGLSQLGFIGVHVIPRHAVLENAALSQSEISCWPHIAWLVRHVCLQGRGAEVLPVTVVKQSGGGAALFWQPSGIVKVVLQRQEIIRHIASVAAPAGRRTCMILRLRDLYAVINLGLAASWKVSEPDQFSAEAPALYRNAYRDFGAWTVTLVPHMLYILLLRAIPKSWVLFMLPRSVRSKILSLDQKRRELPMEFDGEKRKL